VISTSIHYSRQSVVSFYTNAQYNDTDLQEKTKWRDNFEDKNIINHGIWNSERTGPSEPNTMSRYDYTRPPLEIVQKCVREPCRHGPGESRVL